MFVYAGFGSSATAVVVLVGYFESKIQWLFRCYIGATAADDPIIQTHVCATMRAPVCTNINYESIITKKLLDLTARIMYTT